MAQQRNADLRQFFDVQLQLRNGQQPDYAYGDRRQRFDFNGYRAARSYLHIHSAHVTFHNLAARQDGHTRNLSFPLNGHLSVPFNSASAQGSTAITNYVWRSNGTQICGNSSTCSYNFGTAGNTITLTVTDSNGLSSTATGQLNLSFYSALAASCSISPNPITLGTGGTVYAQALGGISPYSYIINGFNMGSVSSQAIMPTSLGTFTVPVTIF